MNLKQLKVMIAEEYKYWLAEQPVDAPDMPGVEVGPNDVNAMGGGDDSEATLRQIYDMLKSYFEGGAAGAPGAPAGMDMDMDMDAEDMDAEDMDDEDEEDVSEEKDDKKDKKESKKDKEDLKERFKKLANIVKG